jgi:hypothetical protein
LGGWGIRSTMASSVSSMPGCRVCRVLCLCKGWGKGRGGGRGAAGRREGTTELMAARLHCHVSSPAQGSAGVPAVTRRSRCPQPGPARPGPGAPPTHAHLGRHLEDVGAIEADDLLDLGDHPLGLGAGQVDLVQHHHDLQVVLQGQPHVGQRLGLHALRQEGVGRGGGVGWGCVQDPALRLSRQATSSSWAQCF